MKVPRFSPARTICRKTSAPVSPQQTHQHINCEGGSEGAEQRSADGRALASEKGMVKEHMPPLCPLEDDPGSLEEGERRGLPEAAGSGEGETIELKEDNSDEEIDLYNKYRPEYRKILKHSERFVREY